VDDTPYFTGEEWEQWAHAIRSATVELHPGLISSKHWWACDRPEQIDEAFTQYDVRCRACVVAMGSAAYCFPITQRFNSNSFVSEDGGVQIHVRETYEWARRLHDLPPVPPRRAHVTTP
jgi:hypothetical protein